MLLRFILSNCSIILMKGNILQTAKKQTQKKQQHCFAKKYELLLSEQQPPEVDPPRQCELGGCFAAVSQRCCCTRCDAHGQFERVWILGDLLRDQDGSKDGERVGKQRLKCFSNGGMAERDPASLPAEVRAKLAELELELSEGEFFTCTRRCCCLGRRWGARGSGIERLRGLRGR